MKRLLGLILSVFMLISLTSCDEMTQQEVDRTQITGSGSNNQTLVFTKLENGNLVSSEGVEYAHLANEGILYYLGETEFVGAVDGEPSVSSHLGMEYRTGMFAIKGTQSQNILIRCWPDNEWAGIYRRSDLPIFDFDAQNCVRLELVPGSFDLEGHHVHTTCGEGMVGEQIGRFLSDIRTQLDPHTAGYYDMIKKPNGMLENCYIYATVYGFFEEEPNLVIEMPVTSYNDLAYSIEIQGQQYVLPEHWLEKLENNS